MKLTLEKILSELNITGEVLAVFEYGSQVYGTATVESDYDFIIVMRGAMLPSGAFRDNAISNADWSIQGVVYSRGGFLDAINNYEIGALECLSLDPSQVIVNDWDFKVTNWNTKTMVKAIIRKASDSRHLSKMQSKNGDKERAIKSMFHSLRILHFGLQLKEHQKVVNFQECNGLYEDFKKLKPENFDSRNYFRIFDELLIQLRK
jgi:predicted nucleotidyltransferase